MLLPSSFLSSRIGSDLVFNIEALVSRLFENGVIWCSATPPPPQVPITIVYTKSLEIPRRVQPSFEITRSAFSLLWQALPRRYASTTYRQIHAMALKGHKDALILEQTAFDVWTCARGIPGASQKGAVACKKTSWAVTLHRGRNFIMQASTHAALL